MQIPYNLFLMKFHFKCNFVLKIVNILNDNKLLSFLFNLYARKVNKLKLCLPGYCNFIILKQRINSMHTTSSVLNDYSQAFMNK